MQNVIVIFQAAQQSTESLALAVGLGAVQGGANIRLRHLDPTPSVELAHAGYGTLRTDDLRWAEGVAIVLESTRLTGLGELPASMEALANDVPTACKWALLIQVGPDGEAHRFVSALLKKASFQNLEGDSSTSITPDFMTQMGHKLASMPA